MIKFTFKIHNIIRRTETKIKLNKLVNIWVLKKCAGIRVHRKHIDNFKSKKSEIRTSNISI